MTGRVAHPTVVSVLVDLTGLERSFDYSVPDELAGRVAIGVIVRVPLQGRRLRGWVVALGVMPQPGVALRPLLEVVSLGPSPEIVDLGRFGAWRYAGRLRPFLVAASPERIVTTLPAPSPGSRPLRLGDDPLATAVRAGFGHGEAVLRAPPASSRLVAVTAACALAEQAGGDLLVLVPERHDAATLVGRLESLGRPAALVPEAWAEAAAGGRVVVGTRAAALAPMARLGAILVLDAHDEAYVEQRSPTWQAPVLAAERARRAGVPCLLVSACPTLEQLAGVPLVTLERGVERGGWPLVEVLDRREDDPRSGLYHERLGEIVRRARRAEPDRPVVCVLNRTGRARLLACGSCGELVRCEHCDAAVREEQGEGDATAQLCCPRCGTRRPMLCSHCGSTRLKRLRVGVARAREELAGIVGEPVGEVSAANLGRGAPLPTSGVLVGTEAVLHRARRASLVVFLDLDQELTAPRYRAAEQALALVARAARLVGGATPGRPAPAAGRAPGGIVIQTRLPGHEVVQAAVHADPSLVAAAEGPRRRALRLPPEWRLALVSGEGVPVLAGALAGSPPGTLEVNDLAAGRLLVRAASSALLADALRAAGAPSPALRVEVDPLRI